MKPEKKIMAISRAQYRGVSLYEFPNGVGVFLGSSYLRLPMIFAKLQDATNYIDEWYDLKKN